MKADFKDYDLFVDGKNKGTFLTGLGAFVYVEDGIPNVTFMSPIDEMCEMGSNGRANTHEDAMYGFESDMIELGVEYDYPIFDVSKNESYLLAHKLEEPYRSECCYTWLENAIDEDLEDLTGLVETGFGLVDVDKVKLAYEFYNKIKTK